VDAHRPSSPEAAPGGATGSGGNSGRDGGSTSKGGSVTAGGSSSGSADASTGSTDASTAPDAPPTCAATVFDAKSAAVDMYIMFDQSSSMGDPVSGASPPTSWWQAAQGAVTSFVNDPRATAAGLAVGIQYFPLGGQEPQSCQADYKTPEVEIAPLPGNAAAIVASLKAHQPSAFTPTSAALAGALAHMKAWAPAHPGRVPVVVFVTDGFPTECEPRDITDISQLAKTAFETQPKVRTFVVGFNFGPGGANLNELAVAGGTNAPFLIDRGDVGTQFVSAMLGITSTRLACEFDVKVPAGIPLGGNQVVVTFTPVATMVETVIPRLNGLGDCSVHANNGWFFDSPTKPTHVELCPGTCGRLAAGKLKVTVGCQTMPGDTR
jgi:hypothetical protein